MTTWLVVVNSEVHTLGNPPVFNGTRATHNVPSQAVEGGSDTPLWPIWRCNIQYRICPVARRVISWQSPSVTSFRLCFSLGTQVVLFLGFSLVGFALNQWLSKVAVQGSSHFCPAWTLLLGNFCLGVPRKAGTDFVRCVQCSLVPSPIPAQSWSCFLSQVLYLNNPFVFLTLSQHLLPWGPQPAPTRNTAPTKSGGKGRYWEKSNNENKYISLTRMIWTVNHESGKAMIELFRSQISWGKEGSHVSLVYRVCNISLFFFKKWLDLCNVIRVPRKLIYYLSLPWTLGSDMFFVDLGALRKCYN